MKGKFLLYGIFVVIVASMMSWGTMLDGASGGSAWRSSSGPGSGGWSSGGHK